MTVDLLMMLFAASVIFISFVYAFRKPALKPRGVAAVLEILVLFVRDDIVYPVMGEKKGEKWLPFFTTLFTFLLLVNFLGLIPAFKTATGNITVTTSLALLILMLIFVIGFRQAGAVGFFKELYPEGTAPAVGLFVALMEVHRYFHSISGIESADLREYVRGPSCDSLVSRADVCTDIRSSASSRSRSRCSRMHWKYS